MFKALRFSLVLALFEFLVLLPCFFLFDSALLPLIALNAILFGLLFYSSQLLMGQIGAQMASSSTHLEDFLILETISGQLRVQLPGVYVYHSKQINSYLLKGPLNSASLAISSECFSSLSLEERSVLYRYQMTRMLFPLHLELDTSVSFLSLLNMWMIDLLFLPINIFRKRISMVGNNHLQQTFKLVALPLLHFCQNFILGREKHLYIKSTLKNSVHQEHFMPVYFKARQLFMKAPLEYDFLSCSGFMGFRNDLFSVLTETYTLDNYMWKQI